MAKTWFEWDELYDKFESMYNPYPVQVVVGSSAYQYIAPVQNVEQGKGGTGVALASATPAYQAALSRLALDQFSLVRKEL